MDDTRKKVLPFPAQLEAPPRPEIFVQVGNECFVIRWEIEELPAAAPVRALRKEPQNARKFVKQFRSVAGRKQVIS